MLVAGRGGASMLEASMGGKCQGRVGAGEGKGTGSLKG